MGKDTIMKTARNLAIVSVLISVFVAGCKKKEPVAYKATVPTPAKATPPGDAVLSQTSDEFGDEPSA